MGFVQLGTVAEGAHCRGIQSRPRARGLPQPLCSGIPRSLLGRRRCASSLPGRSAPSPFLCSVYTRLLPRQDSKWRPSPLGRHQPHTPRGASKICSVFRFGHGSSAPPATSKPGSGRRRHQARARLGR
ncbi:hypothetical protein NDU88_005254 [Pleurodeles waltl]|uniref:Uncharacterized protein n=1 Tax=Pleurodeles waltl TaxID=8319 RepID=A0AAV7RMS4_PLEWA|nr:hypothetical protein NDU88_005254 [Pleurodeles waltl]